MVRGLYTAWTGLRNEERRMDVVTNNMANVTTTGFKKEGSTSQSFKDVFTVKVKDASIGLANVQGSGIRNPGVKIGENYVDYSQGSFKETGNVYDVALSGDGFFVIEFTNKAGETSNMFTRAGQFTLTKEGDLVTEEGDYVLDVNNRHIRVNTMIERTEIMKDGSIYQNDQFVAQIQVADFEDYDYLERYGETYFRPLQGARQIEGTAETFEGYLEMANVLPVSEMVNLITISRQYEANQKIIQTYDDSLEIAVSQLGRVT